MTDENALVARVFDLMTRLRLTQPEGDPMTDLNAAFDVARELRDNDARRHSLLITHLQTSILWEIRFWFLIGITGDSSCYDGKSDDLNEALLLAAEKALAAWAKEEEKA